MCAVCAGVPSVLGGAGLRPLSEIPAGETAP